ncbi:hypothetical protein BJ546DRAFT_597511 [Cryomyces antarcticus]
MPAHTTACGRAVRQLTPQPAHHIWISDDLLIIAFHRFLRVSNSTRKRYGSNVPGPLEAQRRLARRRMMGLATAGGVGAPDMGALFGLGRPVEQSWTWEAPRSPPQLLEETLPPPLPSWLTDYVPSALEDEPDVPFDGVDTASASSLNEAEHLPGYEERLRQFAHLHKLRIPNTPYLTSSTSEAAAYSALVFEHILSECTSSTLDETHFQCLVGFLREPDLNIAHRRNWDSMISFCASLDMTEMQFQLFFTGLEEALNTTGLSEEGISITVQKLFAAVNTFYANRSPQASSLLLAYQVIWKFLPASDLTSVWQPASDLLQQLLQRFWSLSTSTETTFLILDVYSRLSSSDRTSFNTIVPQRLASWIRLVGLDAAGSSVPMDIRYEAILTEMLNATPADQTSSIVSSVTRNLVSRKPCKKFAFLSKKHALEFWLRGIRHCQLLANADLTGETWNAIHATLADRVSAGDIATHLASMSATEATQIIFQHWVRPYILQLKARPNTWDWIAGRRTVGDAGVRSTKYFYRGNFVLVNPTDLDIFHAIKEHLEIRLQASPDSEIPSLAPFINLLAVLAQHKQPYDATTKDVFTILRRSLSPESIVDLAASLARDKKIFMDPFFAASLVDDFAVAGHVKAACDLFRLVPNVWLSLCPHLPIALINDPSGHKTGYIYRIFEMLNRDDPENSVPHLLRTPHHTTAVTQTRIDLIHLIAYAFADCPHLLPRVAFRRVYWLYRYLRARQAPLSSLLSRAFVRAGIIRPLQEGQWVSTVKCQWILCFVKTLEGEEIAEQMDRVVWTWRGRVIRERSIREWRARQEARKPRGRLPG